MAAGKLGVALIVTFAFVLAGCVKNAPGTVTPEAAIAPAATSYYDGTGKVVPAPAEFATGGLNVAEVLLGQRGGEPNIGINAAGHIFTTAGHATMMSADHGKTWKVVFNLSAALPQSCDPVPPIPTQGCPVTGVTRSSDPMLAVDPMTGRVFTDHMTGLYCSNMIISDDEYKSYTMKPLTCGLPVNDHQKVAVGGYGPTVPVPTNPVYPNVVYYCYNKLVATNCAVSHNGGLQFEYDRPVAVGLTDGCGGINGVPAAHPDGTVFVPMSLGCDGPVVGVSEDNGLTWEVRKGPVTKGGEELDPEITVTKDGTAYMQYRGKDHLQYLARSKDKFQHWEGPWQVSPGDVKSTVFAGMASGDNGRIAMAYLGTRDSKEEPSKAANATRWHLFVTYSLDANAAVPTFATTQVTPNDDPVQIGCVWLNGGGNPCRNLLDFIDASADKDGRFFVALTDGCTKKCAGNLTATNNQSRSRDGAVAVLIDGPSLFVAKGRLTDPWTNMTKETNASKSSAVALPLPAMPAGVSLPDERVAAVVSRVARDEG